MHESEWAHKLGNEIKEWCVKNGYLVFLDLAHELGIPKNTWDQILGGHTIARDTTIYARIYHRTSITKSDPRELPPKPHYVPTNRTYRLIQRKWPTLVYESWLKQYEGKETKHPVKIPVKRRGKTTARRNSMYDKPEWARKLSDAFDQWCKTSGIKYKTRLHTYLGISKASMSTISSADNILERDVQAYARLFQFTGLSSADPRTIPPRKVYVVKQERFEDHQRAWTQEQWEEWKNHPKGGKSLPDPTQPMPSYLYSKYPAGYKAHMSLPRLVGTRATPTQHKEPTLLKQVEEPATVQPSGQAGDLLAEFIRQIVATSQPVINVELFADQVATKVAAKLAAELPRNSHEEYKIEPLPARRHTEEDISALAGRLTELLRPFTDPDNSAERERMLRRHVAALVDLYALLSPLTLNPKARETALKNLGRMK